jgi:hypothetical protein
VAAGVEVARQHAGDGWRRAGRGLEKAADVGPSITSEYLVG